MRRRSEFLRLLWSFRWKWRTGGRTNHNMCYTLRIQRVNAVRAAFRESILPFSSPFASNITSIYEQFSFAPRRRSFRLFAPDCLGCPWSLTLIEVKSWIYVFRWGAGRYLRLSTKKRLQNVWLGLNNNSSMPKCGQLMDSEVIRPKQNLRTPNTTVTYLASLVLLHLCVARDEAESHIS